MPFGERVQQALENETKPAEQLRAARASLLAHVTSEGGKPRVSQRRRWIAFAAVPATVALALGLAVDLLFFDAISFATPRGQRSVGDVLEGDRHTPLRVDFSEGSVVLLHRNSRARVLDTHASGARVLLERGTADVAITHRAGRGTRWRFEAGPFQVLVKGTQFEVAWQPESQALSIKMRTGSVELSGPCLKSPRTLERGATVRVSCTPETPPTAAAAKALATPEPAAVVTTPAAKGAALPAHKPAAATSFEARCETASLAELVSWANRERLAGSLARARTALLTLRRRFPEANESGTAAFTLGRMAFDQRGDYRDAAHWFQIYRSEQPNGALLGDAAGRLLEAYERQGRTAAAQAEAKAYLQRYPDGPYASRARRILGE